MFPPKPQPSTKEFSNAYPLRLLRKGKFKKSTIGWFWQEKHQTFQPREYNVPLTGKIPFDFRKIEGFAKLLNSEMTREEALELAKQQIEALHRFLLQQDIDRIVEADHNN